MILAKLAIGWRACTITGLRPREAKWQGRMSIGDFLKSLLLDAWYKALIYIGGLTLVLSLFLEVKDLSNSQVQQVALGVFLLGLGEWKNHKEVSTIKPPNAYTGPAMILSGLVWRPDLVGLLLDGLGVALIALGFRSILLGG